MSICTHFFAPAPIFKGNKPPEGSRLAGYAAIIKTLRLAAPMPEKYAIIAAVPKKLSANFWDIYPESYAPKDGDGLSEMEALYNQLVFALKYEGINLLVFKKISQFYTKTQLDGLVNIAPSGQYSRRIWFLLEWLGGEQLARPDLHKKNYIDLVDSALQYTCAGTKSPRHLVVNNLLGTVNFCPLIRRTPRLDAYINSRFGTRTIPSSDQDFLQRAAAFLLLQDSKASFSIEGENPRDQRISRWGNALGAAGTADLTKDFLCSLQMQIIENQRNMRFGYREQGGFVGEHDPHTGMPMPAHISAKPQDIAALMDGLLETKRLLLASEVDAVLVAAVVAFGFVFIHPFQDGNGRIHRYLIHHVLAKKGFSGPQNIFPVSKAIFDNMRDYRLVLEAHSLPLLEHIDWEETADHNIKVRNESIDYYRYYDATAQAEFLYACVQRTAEEIVPSEIKFLRRYDAFKRELQSEYGLEERQVALIHRFLQQNAGRLSKRAQEKEFSFLSAAEIGEIEEIFRDIYVED